MNNQQKQALTDLILLGVTMAMAISSTVILVLGDFSLSTFNLILIGTICGWLFYHRRTQAS